MNTKPPTTVAPSICSRETLIEESLDLAIKLGQQDRSAGELIFILWHALGACYGAVAVEESYDQRDVLQPIASWPLLSHYSQAVLCAVLAELVYKKLIGAFEKDVAKN